jgi:5'-AMP-activated protein kinase catalytic alpha subunit
VDPTKRFRIEDIRKHKWWNLSPPTTSSQGLIVGYHRIPIDEEILKATIELGFDFSFTRKCIEANRHNDATTTYYLLLRKFVREGGISKAYLGSKYFDSSLIEPLRKVVPDSNVTANIDSHAFDQTAPSFNSKEPINTEKNSSSQPGIGRKSYHLVNNVISRRREFSKQE